MAYFACMVFGALLGAAGVVLYLFTQMLDELEAIELWDDDFV